jgi:hypothetical protein
MHLRRWPEKPPLLYQPLQRRGSALLFRTEVRGDVQYQLVNEFMPLSMALAIADDCAALPADLSTLANANLCHGGTSHSCDRSIRDAGQA